MDQLMIKTVMLYVPPGGAEVYTVYQHIK